jgi:hypothetical protein
MTHYTKCIDSKITDYILTSAFFEMGSWTEKSSYFAVTNISNVHVVFLFLKIKMYYQNSW